MNIRQRLDKIEQQLNPESCHHLRVIYGDDGSGAQRPPDPEPQPCCEINRPVILRVIYGLKDRDEDERI